MRFAFRSFQAGGARATWLVCLALVAAAAALMVLIFSTEPEAQREGGVRESAALVDVTTPSVGDFRPRIRAMGRVLPAREVTLQPRVAGEVAERSSRFDPGRFVEQGDVLLRLDDADYRIAVSQRRSDLNEALAALEIERAEQQAARADYERFDRELPPERRALVLREPQMRAAEAAVDSARAALAQSELNLERTAIDAPFDAQVLAREVDLGSQVGNGQALGRLVGVETYWVEATVQLSDLSWLNFEQGDREGSLVRVRNRTAWAEGAFRTGRLMRLVGELDETTRLARVMIAIDDPLARNEAADAPSLLLGEYVECRIEGRRLRDVARISREHLRGGDTVWLMVDDRLVIRPVEVALEDEAFAYITAGLAADDRVVTTRLATVEPGLRLRTEGSGELNGTAPTP
jgi:RND family efflux transporter MFP subunit